MKISPHSLPAYLQGSRDPMGFFSGYVESASVLFQNDLDINLFKVPVEGINLIDISFIHDDECERIIDTDGVVL